MSKFHTSSDFGNGLSRKILTETNNLGRLTEGSCMVCICFSTECRCSQLGATLMAPHERSMGESQSRHSTLVSHAPR